LTSLLASNVSFPGTRSAMAPGDSHSMYFVATAKSDRIGNLYSGQREADSSHTPSPQEVVHVALRADENGAVTVPANSVP
jgi:hypothetical protein